MPPSVCHGPQAGVLVELEAEKGRLAEAFEDRMAVAKSRAESITAARNGGGDKGATAHAAGDGNGMSLDAEGDVAAAGDEGRGIEADMLGAGGEAEREAELRQLEDEEMAGEARWRAGWLGRQVGCEQVLRCVCVPPTTIPPESHHQSHHWTITLHSCGHIRVCCVPLHLLRCPPQRQSPSLSRITLKSLDCCIPLC